MYRGNNNELPTLSFIECKYLSEVDTYFNKEANDFKYKQITLQELILKFYVKS